jgi:hypothetical protein
MESDLAAALLPHTPELSARATDHLFAVIPALAASYDQSGPATSLASCSVSPRDLKERK